MNNTKSKKVINRVILITIFILLSLGLYINSSFATKEEDKIWNVKITNENKDLTLEKIQNIKFISEDNKNVVSGKIAPGTTAKATIDLDLTGTETAVDLAVDLDEENIEYNQFKLTVFLDGEIINLKETRLIELEDNKVFTEQNGKKTITIELQWDNENDAEDTLIGTNANEIIIPLKVTVTQHI